MPEERGHETDINWQEYSKRQERPTIELNVTKETLFKVFGDKKFQDALVACRTVLMNASIEQPTPEGTGREVGFEVYLDAKGEPLIPVIRLGDEDSMIDAVNASTIDGEEVMVDRQPLITIHSHLGLKTQTDVPIVPSPTDLTGTILSHSALGGIVHFVEGNSFALLLCRHESDTLTEAQLDIYEDRITGSLLSPFSFTQSTVNESLQEAGFSAVIVDFVEEEDGMYVEPTDPDASVFEGIVLKTY